MKIPPVESKIFSLSALAEKAAAWKAEGRTIAFTNGCFDILHAGHIFSLSQAAAEGDVLVVAVNADASIQGLKGPGRPVNQEQSRALVIASLCMVDAVVIFSEPTPLQVIVAVRPDVLVKGGDYTPEQIAGSKEVIGWGGRVVINPVIKGFSTTSIINRITGGNP
ncbi:MAG TPA: D-glycero-beta-D-manno-heptose 1-phosphate adenylyltransferase [Flavisolibacter sp.]